MTEQEQRDSLRQTVRSIMAGEYWGTIKTDDQEMQNSLSFVGTLQMVFDIDIRLLFKGLGPKITVNSVTDYLFKMGVRA